MRHLELDEPRHLNQGKPNRKGNKGRIRLERADRRVALEPINLLRPIELNPTNTKAHLPKQENQSKSASRLSPLSPLCYPSREHLTSSLSVKFDHRL